MIATAGTQTTQVLDEAASGTRGLVADDDAMVRLLAMEALDGLGIAAQEACDGEEALAILEASPEGVDLILLDLSMPKKDGFAVCSKLKDIPAARQATVVVITGAEDLDSIYRAFEAGASDFITKPISWPILIQRLRYILRARATLRRLQESESRLAEAQHIARLGSLEWNTKSGEVRCSPEALRLLGQDPQARIQTYDALLECVHPEDRSAVAETIAQGIDRGQPFAVEHRIVLPGGDVRVIHTKGVRHRRRTDGPNTVRAVIQDITERKRAEERIHRLVYYDDMTGLPNRELCIRYLEDMLASVARSGSQMALISVDLDRFKRINESLGRRGGDELLRLAAERFKKAASGAGYAGNSHFSGGNELSVARLAGDEFLFVLGGIGRADFAASFAQYIFTQLAQPILVDNTELFVTASIGIAYYPNDGTDADTLLKHANVALEHAKRAGGNCYRFFSSDMNRQARARLSLEARLHRAVQNQELEVYYQPQASLSTDHLTGMEALLRWSPENGAAVSPKEFIPVAEETGLIVPIGTLVLSQVCAQLATWQAQGRDLVPVAINLSARQFERRSLTQEVRQALDTVGVPPSLLEIELTERVIMNDVVETRRKLSELKEIGVCLSVDDFGTGYSSMSYLKRFPLDKLKVDRSFVSDLVRGSVDEGIIKAIVALAKSLGLATIAEGVETNIQKAVLAKLGCDLYQGFLFSRPESAADAILRLDSATMHNKDGS